MRDRGILLVLLASALTFLASLYLPWEEAYAPQLSGAGGSGAQGLLNLFSGAGGLSVDGWGPFGQAAGVLALGLVAGAAASIVRPRLVRLPLGICAFALGFFAVLSMFDARNEARVTAAFAGVPVHVAVGSYLALASGTVACVSAIALRRSAFEGRLKSTAAFGIALTAGALASFLIPVVTFHIPHVSRGGATGYQELTLAPTLPIFICGLALLGLSVWSRATGLRERLAVAVAVAVLTGGYLSFVDTYLQLRWNDWLLLGCSVALVALALATAKGLRVRRPSPADAVAFAAGVLLVSLFLPWQKLAPTSGWASGYSATAGGLVVVLVALLFATSRFSRVLAIGTAIYVMAAGFEIAKFTSFRYGAPLGFAGAALLLLQALRQARQFQPIRLVPAIACGAFLAIPILAYSERFSFALEVESPWRLFWLELAAILVALLLLGRWLDGRRNDPALILLPLALLALTALNLIEYRSDGISWGGIATVGLCLLLVAFGWIEKTEGLESLSEIFRFWRIPESES